MFIVPIDLSREWYRYHRLFRDLLLHRLQMLEGVEETAFHLRASEWYEVNGFHSDAVHHTLTAKELAWTSELLLSTSEKMLQRGEIGHAKG